MSVPALLSVFAKGPLHMCAYVCLFMYMLVCVYMCLCASVCMFVPLRVCLFACVCIYIYIYICVYVPLCVYVCVHVPLCVYVCVHVPLCVCVCLCACVCVYANLWSECPASPRSLYLLSLIHTLSAHCHTNGGEERGKERERNTGLTRTLSAHCHTNGGEERGKEREKYWSHPHPVCTLSH